MTYSFSAINTPISGARNPVPYIKGLTADFATVTTLTLNIGACSDSNNLIDIVVPTAITISGTAQGVNGIDAAAVLTASSIYYVFVIGDSSGFNLPAGLISLSPTAPKLPSGYDSFRMVDIKATNSVPNFILSYTNGQYEDREFIYDAPVSVLASGGDASFTAVSLANVVAPIGTPMVRFIASIIPVASTGAGDSITLRPTGSASSGFAVLSGGIVSKGQVADLECIAFLDSGDQSVDYVLTDSGDVGALWVKSYTYNL
jgi:hypothetical protein